MARLSFQRLFAPAVLAAVLGVAGLSPGKAQASDDLVRVLVDVADIIYHSGQPYYRHGNYGRYDRVVIVRDRYHRPAYYRYVPRDYRVVYRGAPPYGRAHGHYRDAPRYYDHRVRYDRRHDRYGRYDRRHDRDDRYDRYDRRHDDRRYGHHGGKGNNGRGRWDD
jgi:hypothetical protein